VDEGRLQVHQQTFSKFNRHIVQQTFLSVGIYANPETVTPI